MILQIRNLTIQLLIERVLTPVVRAVTFEVARGEILGIVGESGCGKSITSFALMGLLPPGSAVTADRLELCGQDLRRLSARDWRKIRGSKAALIFQNPMSALNPSLTIGTQLSESIRKADPGFGRRQLEKRTSALLDQVGLGSTPLLVRAYAHELSGGMAQRIMIAMALACRPSLLIADEPTTALDATNQAQILDLLVRVRDENDMAVILVSHDIGLVEEHADRIMVMYSGEIVETAPTAVLASCSRHPYTQGLLRSLPDREGIPPKAPLTTIPGVVPPIGQSMQGCRFAPRCPYACDRCQSHPNLVPREDYPSAAFRCFFEVSYVA
jgi:oligopeptide/dipeptide ABC transporter ATP-binding protein